MVYTLNQKNEGRSTIPNLNISILERTDGYFTNLIRLLRWENASNKLKVPPTRRGINKLIHSGFQVQPMVRRGEKI
jgi:hypothetical protein